jgi:mannan endo-1,4-beta-mannosidase
MKLHPEILAALSISAVAFAQSAPPAPGAAAAAERQQILQQIQQLQQRLQQLPGPAPGFGPGPGARPAPPPPYACDPVNSEATPEARALLKNLCAISGKYILSGQHNFPARLSLHSDKLARAVDKYPAIWSSDFGFTGGDDQDSVTHRQEMIDEAQKQAAQGSIITLCWHMLRPTEDEPGTPGASWRGSVQARLTDDQWAELITPDTPLHKRWEKYMDTAAGYLKQLRDARIPVLFRPMHENNGNFFWWGGRPGMGGTAELYRQVYARMVYVHHLDNLLWVWNQNGPAPVGEFINFFPGHKYADIISYDNYSPLGDRYYYELLALADGKPVALGEIGQPFAPELLNTQSRWVYFTGWSNIFERWGDECRPNETEEQCQTRQGRLKALFADPRVLNRGELAGKLK